MYINQLYRKSLHLELKHRNTGNGRESTHFNQTVYEVGSLISWLLVLVVKPIGLPFSSVNCHHLGIKGVYFVTVSAGALLFLANQKVSLDLKRVWLLRLTHAEESEGLDELPDASMWMSLQWDRMKDDIVENFAAKYHQAAPPSFEEAGLPSAFNQLEC